MRWLNHIPMLILSPIIIPLSMVVVAMYLLSGCVPKEIEVKEKEALRDAKYMRGDFDAMYDGRL